jgi:heme/copper-type cytochrome/quinol oxidase subunit 2
MRLPELKQDERGQAAAGGAVTMQLMLIISLLVAVIVVYQLFIARVGPTDNRAHPDFCADALEAYNNVVTLSWAGIGLMAVSIIILAASVIIGVVRGFGGGPGGV